VSTTSSPVIRDSLAPSDRIRVVQPLLSGRDRSSTTTKTRPVCTATARAATNDGQSAGPHHGRRGSIQCFPSHEMVWIGEWSSSDRRHRPQRMTAQVWSHNQKICAFDSNRSSAAYKSCRPRGCLSDGSRLQSTADHRLWTINRWVEACNLTSVDMLPGSPVFDNYRCFADSTRVGP